MIYLYVLDTHFKLQSNLRLLIMCISRKLDLMQSSQPWSWHCDNSIRRPWQQLTPPTP